MLYGVAFLTIVVAAITSIFVTRASRDRGIAEGEAEQRIEARPARRLASQSHGGVYGRATA
jgi:hypothetical protein